jgi:hypothetical protein
MAANAAAWRRARRRGRTDWLRGLELCAHCPDVLNERRRIWVLLGRDQQPHDLRRALRALEGALDLPANAGVAEGSGRRGWGRRGRACWGLCGGVRLLLRRCCGTLGSALFTSSAAVCSTPRQDEIAAWRPQLLKRVSATGGEKGEKCTDLTQLRLGLGHYQNDAIKIASNCVLSSLCARVPQLPFSYHQLISTMLPVLRCYERPGRAWKL